MYIGYVNIPFVIVIFSLLLIKILIQQCFSVFSSLSYYIWSLLNPSMRGLLVQVVGQLPSMHDICSSNRKKFVRLLFSPLKWVASTVSENVNEARMASNSLCYFHIITRPYISDYLMISLSLGPKFSLNVLP